MKGYDTERCAFCRAPVRWDGGLAVHAETGTYWASDVQGRRHHVQIGPHALDADQLQLEVS